jgi:hypothetical protein
MFLSEGTKIVGARVQKTRELAHQYSNLSKLSFLLYNSEPPKKNLDKSEHISEQESSSDNSYGEDDHRHHNEQHDCN